MPKLPLKYLVYVTINGVMREWFQYYDYVDALEKFESEVRYFSNGVWFGCEIMLHQKEDEAGTFPQIIRQWKFVTPPAAKTESNDSL